MIEVTSVDFKTRTFEAVGVGAGLPLKQYPWGSDPPRSHQASGSSLRKTLICVRAPDGGCVFTPPPARRPPPRHHHRRPPPIAPTRAILVISSWLSHEGVFLCNLHGRSVLPQITPVLPETSGLIPTSEIRLYVSFILVRKARNQWLALTIRPLI